MTRLPQDDRNVVDRPDLPEYELNEECAAPGCRYAIELGGGHHLWRRSFGTKSWWVELADGTVVGNRVGLCNGHHSLVTVNNARITYKDGVFWWLYHGEVGNGHQLDCQPPKWETHEEGEDLELSPEAEAEHREFVKTVAEEHGFPLSDWQPTLAPQPGETCEKCKRRVPHKKKTSSPITKVWSTRVPVGDSDSFSELVDAAAAHHGLTSKPNHRFWTMQYALVLLLQAEAGELPV